MIDTLSEAGDIVDVYLPSDRVTGRPRGFAFVEFSTEDEAEVCIEKFNEYELDGRKLRINPAQERSAPRFRGPDAFAGGPGRGGGGGGGGGRPSRPKGSRRGKRGKKRSL